MSTIWRRRLVCVLCVACVTTLASCSGRKSISGKITCNGQPVPAGRIQFTPDFEQGNKGPVAVGEIKNGVFTIAAEEGHIGGAHKVTIDGTDGVTDPDRPPSAGRARNGNPLFPTVEIACILPDKETTFAHDVMLAGATRPRSPGTMSTNEPQPHNANVGSVAPSPDAPQTPGPPQSVPPSADLQIISLLVNLCQLLALLILVADVIGTLSLLIGAASGNGKSRKPRATHDHPPAVEQPPTVEQQIEQALARSSISLWARVALLVAGAIAVLALLGAAEMMRLAVRVEQKMDFLPRG